MDKLKAELIKNKIQKEPINIRVVSDSMLPLIKIDEQLTLTKLPTELKIFDTIVFYDNGKLICHFVWKDQRALNGTLVTRSLKEPYKNEIPRKYSNIVGWVPTKKISFMIKLKIVLLSWIMCSL